MDIYIELAIDSLFSGLVFPTKGQLYFPVMLFYPDKYNFLVTLIIAFSANSLGIIANFMVGRFVVGFVEKEPFFRGEIERKNKIARDKFNKYLFPVILFAGITFVGGMISFVCGLLKTSYLKAISLILISNIACYIYLLT